VAITLVGLFSIAAAPAAEALPTNSYEAWQNCSLTSAKQLDDGNSDMQSLAVLVAAHCEPEYRAFIADVTRGATSGSIPSRQNMALNGVTVERWDLLTDVPIGFLDARMIPCRPFLAARRASLKKPPNPNEDYELCRAFRVTK
jgi:hypothetical protein